MGVEKSVSGAHTSAPPSEGTGSSASTCSLPSGLRSLANSTWS